ncbi:MAG: hypothetical protein CVV41_22425, partial [Candidatus Riflebacteria bacterium HGW-Riflebacteria-1]
TLGITAQNIESGDKAAVKNVNGLIDIENILTTKIGADIEVTNTVFGNIEITDADAANNLTVAAYNGDISMARGTATTGDTLIKTTDGSITISDKLKTALTTIIEASHNIIARTIESGDKAAVTSTNGLIDIEYISTSNAGADIEIANTFIGDIELTNANAARDLIISAANGNINLITGIAGNNMNINNIVGNTTIDFARAGNDMTLTAVNGDIRVVDAVAGNEMLINTTAGNIDITDATSGKDMTIKANTGNITIARGTATDGNLVVKTETGNLSVTDYLDIGRDSMIIVNEGALTLGTISLGKDLIVTTAIGDITIGKIVSEFGNVTVNAEKFGNLIFGEIVADQQIDLVTGFGGVDADHVESVNGNVNLIAGGAGDINVHELLARGDVKGLAEDGNIMLAKLGGKNVVLVVEHDSRKLTVDEATIGKKMTVTADNIIIDSLKHTGDEDYLQLKFNGADNNQMDNVIIDDIYSDKGVQLQGLWTTFADIHTESDYFRLKDVHVADKGYLSNGQITMTIFGQNPVRDGSDVQIYFAPDNMRKLTQISFQNEFSQGREGYTILYNVDGVKSPFNQYNMMEELSEDIRNKQIALAAGGNLTNVPLVTMLDKHLAFVGEYNVNRPQTGDLNNNSSLQISSIVNVTGFEQDPMGPENTFAAPANANSETETEE